MVDVCLGREEKGTVYICLFMSPGCVFRRVVDKQTKSKFDRTILFFSCDSMPGTIIINQQIHTYLHVPVLLLSQVPHRFEHDTLSSHHYLTWKQIASIYICIGKNVSGIKKSRVHIIE